MANAVPAHVSVRAAALDIGTNTVVLLVADVTPHDLTYVTGESETARLGYGAAADGTLTPESIARAVIAATRFVTRARAAGAASIYVVGTAAVRDAPNRDDLLRRVDAQAGVPCRVLSGDEEAQLTFLGATNGESLSGTLAVGDIGGGSTERIVATDGNVRERLSLPLGSGRLTERAVTQDPPTPAEAAEALRLARESFAAFRPVQARALLLAGGTANALARLQGTRTLDAATLDAALARLLASPAASVAAETGIDAPRIGLLTGGIACVRALAETCGVAAATVAGGGIREGTLLAAARGLLDFPSLIISS